MAKKAEVKHGVCFVGNLSPPPDDFRLLSVEPTAADLHAKSHEVSKRYNSIY
jgi:hypothetical protein